jgi:hypothetical protein
VRLLPAAVAVAVGLVRHGRQWIHLGAQLSSARLRDTVAEGTGAGSMDYI